MDDLGLYIIIANFESNLNELVFRLKLTSNLLLWMCDIYNDAI